MPRTYPTFEQLKDHAGQMYRAYNVIGWEKLNADGTAECRAYGIIVEAFAFCLAKGELVECIRQDIAELKTKINMIPMAELMHGEWREEVAVIQLLRKYIRHNCERELWKDIPEFKTSTD